MVLFVSNAAAAVRIIDAAFLNGSVNQRTIQRWREKFETGKQSLTMEDWDRPETFVDNEILRAIVETNPGNTVRIFEENLRLSSTTISSHLKLICKVKKMDEYVFYQLNENHKCN